MLAKVISFLRSILFPAGRRSHIVVGIVIVLTVGLVVVDVFLRYAFNSPLGFSYEMLGIALTVIVLCSVLYSTSLGKHISIDVLVARFPSKLRKVTIVVVDFLSMCVFFTYGWRCITHTLFLFNLKTATSILKIHMYPFISLIALAFIWAGLLLLLDFIDSIKIEAK